MDPTTDNNNFNNINSTTTHNGNGNGNGNSNGNGNGNGNLRRRNTSNHHNNKKKKKKKKKNNSYSPTSSCSVYRECLKNHAASLGGHALDGCGEFMPSPSSNTSDPSSLTCAACSCHRNFHRRLPLPLLLPSSPFQYHDDDDEDIDDDDDDEDIDDDDDDDDDVDDDRCVSSSDLAHSGSPPPRMATHMLLALSTGGSTQHHHHQYHQQQHQKKKKKKRFRSKFSQEQKEKMQELSEKLGWRMQRRDDAFVETACREIGVTRRVFKVWMHNNKHIFTKKSSDANVNANNANGN